MNIKFDENGSIYVTKSFHTESSRVQSNCKNASSQTSTNFLDDRLGQQVNQSRYLA